MKGKLRFRPYRAKASSESVETVFSRINESIFQAYCREDSGLKLGSLADYGELLEGIKQLRIETVPFCEASLQTGPPADCVQCLIRHDLDIDVVAALRMAELEFAMGVRSSWFVLHTSPYYGEWKNGTFSRHSCMRHVYRRLQDLSHEVALHTDGLSVYQEHGVDGAEAVRTEIDWLREAGLGITGTTAHNSWGVYGAENFAIFKGRPQGAGSKPEDCPEVVEKDGRPAMLQVLDEEELGLDYEANEVFWQDHTPVRYAALRGRGEWRWVDDSSRTKSEVLGGPTGMISAEDVLANLERMKGGEWLVLVIHPVYYGWRHAAHAEPAHQLCAIESEPT